MARPLQALAHVDHLLQDQIQLARQIHVIPGLGRKKLAKLTAKDVRTWLNGLRTVCQCCARGIDARRKPDAQTGHRPRCCALGMCCRKRLSPLTLAYIHSVLKSALEHAVREEGIPRNVRTGTPRPRRFNPLTADEARRFLDAGTATIRRTLQRTNSRGLATLPTKTISSERRIALPASCITALRDHRKQQAQEKEETGSDWHDTGHVFTRPDGHLIELATLTKQLNALLRNAHLRPIRFHDLRHSTATLLLEQGVELVVIKELLGHAHIGVTATVYAHVRLRLQRQAIDLLSQALGNRAESDAKEIR
ncbi:site-specific integrase [Streptomyces sp. NPDC048409]|uniref:tyrosine-type recombinase/integrase n=1 Tax=Streptomyces sp. NPDC048409 TaxID=3154723 RepID=UPI00343154B3